MMVIFCRVKHIKFLDSVTIGFTKRPEDSASFLTFVQSILALIFIINYRTILCANVSSLAIKSSRVMTSPKPFKQSLETCFFWIKIYFYYLSMRCFTSANLLVSRIFNASSCVARDNRFYTI